MRGVIYYTNQNGVGQDDSNIFPVIADDKTVVKGSYFFTTTSTTAIANSLLVPYQLLQDLYAGYEYSDNIEAISESCDDIFLKEHAIRCGYRLTKDFLSIMSKHKTDFIYKVDNILIGLSGLSSGFSSFLKGLEDDGKNLRYLMNKTCSSFSKYVRDLRPKCVNVLRIDIIPITIKNIFDASVIDGSCERKMTYPEMEELFLHFVSTLEKLIMFKIMKYWRNFCDEKDISSLIPDVDYSNPFVCAYNFDGSDIPKISCPAAFNDKFGEYISFMTISKIDDIIIKFSIKCNCKLKDIIIYKCSCICNYSDKIYDDLKKFSDKLKVLIEEEFDRKIVEEGINDKFNIFLNGAVIWKKYRDTEISISSVSTNIIGHMRNLFINVTTSEAYKIVDSFKEKLESKMRSLVLGKYSLAIENNWGVRLHPEDDSKILSIRRKFISKSREIIKDKFCLILKEERKYIALVNWDKISEKLFPIAQEKIRHLVDDEHEELSRFLHNARIVENIDVFDGYYAGTRKTTSEERDSILKISTNHVHRRNRDLSNKIWRGLCNINKINISKDINLGLGKSEEDIAYDVGQILMNPIDGGDSFVANSLIQSEPLVVTPMPVDLVSKRDKVINIWGLNLHPDDDKLIFFIRRKFSIQIRDYLSKLFSGMLRSRTLLPSGRVLCDYSWNLISNDLFVIAIGSVGPIIEKQRVELDMALSKARIVDVNENDSSSCIIRKVTDNEKKELMMRAVKLMDSRLRESIRISWVRTVDKSMKDIRCSYKEKSKGICGNIREGTFGVKLRYSDNIAILNSRKKFSSKIRTVVYDKFINMLRNRHRFGDGTFIELCAWFRVSKRLLPIIKGEVRYMIEDGSKELKAIISGSHAVVDSKVDRELTKEEKTIVFKNVMKLVYASLNCLFRRVWDKIVISLRNNSIDMIHSEVTDSKVDCMGEPPASFVDMVDVTEVNNDCKDDVSKIKLYYEDDLSILNIKKNLSSEICNFISNKFSEMLKNRHIFDDGTTIGTYTWKKMSKNLLPIAEKEIDPLIEKGRIKISDKLLCLHVDISSSDNYSSARAVRNLTSKERFAIMENIIKSVREKVIVNLSRAWNKVIKLPLFGLSCLREEDRSEIENIRLEFTVILSSIVDEVVGSLSSDIDNSLFSLYNIVSNRILNLFKEGGFLDRVELLLSDAKLIDSSGNYKSITDEEKKYMFKEFMNQIDSDGVCLVKNRIRKLDSKYSAMEIYLPSILSVNNIEDDCVYRNKRKGSTISDVIDSEFYDHSYAKKLCY